MLGRASRTSVRASRPPPGRVGATYQVPVEAPPATTLALLARHAPREA